jgi:hypothetical protein
MKKLIALAVILMLPACSLFKTKGDEIVFDTVLGPETDSLLETLPDNLVGDTGNAQYTITQKKGKGMESDDGTGQD